MPNKRQIYMLDPQTLPPETIAVTFAKTSRFPQSFREIAAELTDEKSAEFHEKWVVGYGHSSIAEHAVLHIAFENISRLAVETLESNRLASYTEKSTRYQKWDAEDFYHPAELEGNSLNKLYLKACQHLFESYHQALPLLEKQASKQFPRLSEESPSAYERRIRSMTIDCCRFLLPASALANVGVTINARALEHAIQKMLSSPLSEVREIGMDVKQVAREEVPTLVKYANAVPYLQQAGQLLSNTLTNLKIPGNQNEDWCRLLSYDQEAENKIFAAALYKYSGISYSQAIAMVKEFTPEQRQSLAKLILGELERYDIPLRELEYSSYTFDLILDQGAYCELKRHRMMTQTAQSLTPELGYAIPKLFTNAGIENEYRKAMDTARQAYRQIAEINPFVASYVIPNAYNRRVLISCNLRSLEHFINLRSTPNTHFSMRRVAQRIADQIQDVTPLLGNFIRKCKDETWQGIEAGYFSQTQ